MMTTATKVTGMMFRDDLVRAILDGRKTQTRRPLRKQPECIDHDVWMYEGKIYAGNEMSEHLFHNVYGTKGTPYGSLYDRGGDHIYVQEGAIKIGHERTGKNGQYLWPKLSDSFDEAAARRWFDQSCLYTLDLRHDDPAYDEPHGKLNKMFMPRWASRITLEITDVRVERLAEISIDDSKAEGVMPLYAHECADAGHPHDSRRLFQQLWDSINGAGSFAKSPWVWAISFRRLA